MSEPMVIRHCCKIVNNHGLHTRSAAAIVELAKRFQCSIVLSSDKGESDATDMLRLMLLEASIDKEICIEASGEGAKEAVIAMTELIETGFGE
ncbi:MAG: HPr family phosphocarrier protein [Gammaproteobacteria bacterium]|nr:MAG: HPr family phosphocarrier protein [Gammaproteobacteria bacterium]